MTKGLLVSRVNKIKLYKNYVRTKNLDDLEKFKNFRNIYNRLVRVVKKEYYHNRVENCKNPKMVWDMYNELTNRNVSSKSLNELNINGTISKDDLEISEHFNDFFSSVGPAIAESIPITNIDPMNFLNYPENIPSLDFGEIGPVFISDIIKTFEPKKSVDMDGISMHLLKYIDSAIAVPLAHVFNLSLRSGIFPDKLKMSRVIPIFKSGDSTIPDNYRPISLVNAFGKILEKIVALKLINHLDSNNLIYQKQFGFQKGLSTEHNLIHLVNYVSKAMNDNKFCVGIFLDIKKAFDVVPHDLLLKKLKRLGIKNNALSWFKSYLANRSQCVEINGRRSGPRKIKLSVMQGSVLGPLLFLCFINDLGNVSELFKLLFADDTCALHSDKDFTNLINYANSELQKILTWFSANKLAVNVNKCKYIIFHNRGKVIPDTPRIIFNYNVTAANPDPGLFFPIERVKGDATYKYLGVLLDENLNLNKHSEYICNKLSKALFCLTRVKTLLPNRSLVNLYFALFNSHLLYCVNILGSTSQKNINKIHKLQKKAIRIVKNAPYNAHTAGFFADLDILPFDKLIVYHRALFMHSIKYEYAPASFTNTWLLNNERNLMYNLRNTAEFAIIPPRFEGFKKYPLYCFPFIWNNLDDVKLHRNRTTFKIELKRKLFESL
jgi:hypothetical protein